MYDNDCHKSGLGHLENAGHSHKGAFRFAGGIVPRNYKRVYDNDAMLEAAVEKSRVEIARGEYFTQEQVEARGIELIRQIDNLRYG